jgi:hypothetical protein
MSSDEPSARRPQHQGRNRGTMAGAPSTEPTPRGGQVSTDQQWRNSGVRALGPVVAGCSRRCSSDVHHRAAPAEEQAKNRLKAGDAWPAAARRCRPPARQPPAPRQTPLHWSGASAPYGTGSVRADLHSERVPSAVGFRLG